MYEVKFTFIIENWEIVIIFKNLILFELNNKVIDKIRRIRCLETYNYVCIIFKNNINVLFLFFTKN